MMRSSAYNRFGVLMGTSWPASCPRWYGLREDSLPMITLFPSQGDFYATATRPVVPSAVSYEVRQQGNALSNALGHGTHSHPTGTRTVRERCICQHQAERGLDGRYGEHT